MADQIALMSTKKQADWDKEVDLWERKEAELVSGQWKLIREQMGTQTRDISMAMQHIDTLKHNTQDNLMKTKANFSEAATELDEERSARLAGEDKLAQELKLLKAELAEEKKKREAGDERSMAELKKLADGIDEKFGEASKKHGDLEQELSKLRDALNTFPKELECLHDAIKHEVAERKASQEPILRNINDVRDMLLKELKDHGAGHENSLRGLKDLLETEKKERENGHDNLKGHIGDVHKELHPHAIKVPTLHTKLDDLEGTLHPQIKDQKKALDKMAGDHADKHKNLEDKLMDVHGKVDAEKAARSTMMDEIDQMLTSFRTKMRGLINEQADSARLAREALEAGVRTDLNKEASAREAGDDGMADQLAGQKRVLEGRCDDLQKSLADLEHKLRDEHSQQSKELGKQITNKSDDLTKQLRGVSQALDQAITEERADHEAAFSALEEHISNLEAFFKDVGNRFINNGVRRQRVVQRTSTSGLALPPNGKGE